MNAPRSGLRPKVPVALVVDDCADNRELFAMVLLAAGFAVYAASDGLEGLEAAERMKPDVVVVDLAMPVMDGFEMIARLRAEPHGARTRVLVVSAQSDTTSRGRALAAGCDDFLPKPCTPRALVEGVRAGLRRAG